MGATLCRLCTTYGYISSKIRFVSAIRRVRLVENKSSELEISSILAISMIWWGRKLVCQRSPQPFRCCKTFSSSVSFHLLWHHVFVFLFFRGADKSNSPFACNARSKRLQHKSEKWSWAIISILYASVHDDRYNDIEMMLLSKKHYMSL